MTVGSERTGTPLAQALRTSRVADRKTPLGAFHLARTSFLAGQRIEMAQLAADIGVSRATLYRWVGSREALLGEVIWAATKAELDDIRITLEGVGRSAVIEALYRGLVKIRNAQALREFVADDPEYALRLLTTRQSIVQVGLVGWCTAIVAENLTLKPEIDPGDLSYAIVRVAEGFTWSEMISGDEPSPERAIKIIELLIAGAEDC